MEDTVNRFGVLGGSSLDLSQGTVQPTGNPLDLALQGNGFFQIATAQGTRLTRDGSFQRSNDGTLTTQQGEAVQDVVDVCGMHAFALRVGVPFFLRVVRVEIGVLRG